MRFLLLFLRIFVTAFGLTEPQPHQERKAALFLVGTLAALAVIVAAAASLVFYLAGRS